PLASFQLHAHPRPLHAFPTRRSSDLIAQWREWNHDASLDWHLLEEAPHAGVLRLVGDLNRLYREERALHAGDTDPSGFSWIDGRDRKSTRLNSSHVKISYAVFCLKKK